MKIRVAYPGPPETKDYPSVLAFKSLPKDRYAVEIVATAGIPQASQAVVGGSAEVASTAVALSINAVAKGADVKAIAENVGLPWRIIATRSLTSVADLHGKRFGTTDLPLFNALTEHVFRKTGREIKPTIVKAAQSSDRVQALLQGQLDATMGSIEDFLFVEAQKPGQFHTLVDFAREIPNLGGTYLFANGKFLKDQPQAVQDMVEEILRVYQRVNSDPNYLLVEWQKAFPEQKEAQLKANLTQSMGSKLWVKNARMDKETLDFTTKFHWDFKMIEANLPWDRWAAPQFMEAGLKKVGQ